MARHAVAGLQYLVTMEGEVVLEHCTGLADVARQVAVTPNTTFNLYSITKPFTAMATLLAAADGALRLDAPIAEACGMEALQRFGTVRETLLHRAGFPNPMPLGWYHLATEHAAFDEANFVDARLKPLAIHRPRPGRSAYSNLGYLALGRALERVRGQPFPQVFCSTLIDPVLGPERGSLGFEIAHPGLHAHGLLRRRGLLGLLLGFLVDRRRIVEHRPGPWYQLHHHHVDGSAYGGLMGNARGLAGFGRAMLGLDGKLSAEVGRQGIDRVDGPGPGRSLAWFVGQQGRQAWCAHAGGGVGGYGELRLYPGLKAVSALLTNSPGLRDRRWLDVLDAAWIDSAGRTQSR